jgi:helix-turn-helix protein
MSQPDSVSQGALAQVDKEPGEGEPPVALPSLNFTGPSSKSVVSLVHPKRDYRRRQRWTTPAMVAAYFGVTRRTVVNWLQARHLGAQVAYSRHYTDDRTRKTARGHWRIFEADLEALLTAYRVKRSRAAFGPGFWKGET